jgi:hypothetical protein
MWSRISNNSAGIACSVWRVNSVIVSIGIREAMTSGGRRVAVAAGREMMERGAPAQTRSVNKAFMNAP